MRVAILSESSADEAALRILIDVVLGISTIPVELSLRTRGWSGVRSTLAVIIKRLHYRSDADGLVIVVDSNHTSIIEPGPDNRLHELQQMIQNTRSLLASVSGRVPLKIALGIASPAIEAWLLCKRFSDLSEGRWEYGLKQQSDPYSKIELKRRLYYVDFPSLQLETKMMIEAANEIAADISLLERQFPTGFGTLVQQLREWRRIG